MKKHLSTLLLPLLLAAYPIVFLYGQNAAVLDAGNLKLPLTFSLLAAGLSYALFFLFQRKPVHAGLSAAVFVLFYYLYGYGYRWLLNQDKFPVQHFILLPLAIFLVGYAGYFIAFIKPTVARTLQKVLLVIAAGLVFYNLAITAPVEAQKILSSRSFTPAVQASASVDQKRPDIYYIILDEYAGSEAIQDYWHDDYMNEFEAFLNGKGFFVATASRSPTINTASEIASRLNLQQFAENADNSVKMKAINNNKVMQVLKSYGYTTVVMDMAFPGIQADVRERYDTQSVGGMATDEFKKTFLDDTMYDAFRGLFEDADQAAVKQRDMVISTLDKTANLSGIPSPKFVFTHVLLPHEPFIFDENGDLLPPQASDDWHFYLGQHKYTTKLAEQLITKLLAKADPDNPPVIILQSDHGARNLERKTKDNIALNGILENYPGRDMHMILNALYLPGYNTGQLHKDMPPIDTFAVVLNFYLNAGVKVEAGTSK